MERSPFKPRCPRCNSTQCYYRSKSEDFTCRTCANEWKMVTPYETPINQEQNK